MAEKLRLWARSVLLVKASDCFARLTPESAQKVAKAFEEADGTPLRDEERGAFVEELARGGVVLVRLQRAWRPLDRVKKRPLIDPDEPRPVDPRPRPTWVALELRGPEGERFPDATVRVRLPDGTLRVERVDERSRWRADDVVTAGTCWVELWEAGEPRPDPGGAPAPEATVVEAGDAVPVVTGRDHVLRVEPAFLYTIAVVDEDDQPVRGETVSFRSPDGTLRTALTDAQGRVALRVPWDRDCAVRLPDRSAPEWKELDHA